MYEELIKHLRFYQDGTLYYKQAADAIEELSKRVPVPPHGRLIDETWLNMQIQTAKEIHANEKHDFCNAFDSNGHVCTEWWCVEDMIENAPTIIPASEEGVKTEDGDEPWLCLSCRHYPPSSTDGKPCTQCNPSEVWHSCYDPVEEGE